jgi:hypothetical protein
MLSFLTLATPSFPQGRLDGIAQAASYYQASCIAMLMVLPTVTCYSLMEQSNLRPVLLLANAAMNPLPCNICQPCSSALFIIACS